MIKQTYLIICILLGVWLTACQDFEDPVNNSSVVDGNMVEVSIKTNVPAITVQTKAGATDDENKIEHVDVLVFEVDKNDQNKETFAYRTTNTNTLSTPDSNNAIEIKTKLKISQDGEKYRIVFIANLKEEVASILGDDDEQHTTKTKKALLEELTFTQEQIWADTDSPTRPLPMWGEASETTAITKDITSGAFGNLYMLRSVARIGLSVSLSESSIEGGSDIFEIKSVRVYKAREKGLAAPNPEPGYLVDGEAKLPSLTGSGQIGKDNSKYTLPDNAGNKITGIYINEASNQDPDEAVFLIIEAIYKKENPSNQKPTFYKVGFYDTNDDPVDILRNFTYNMVITGVSGKGEDNEKDAVQSTTGHLAVSMTNWSGGEMKYVVFNGKHYLAVSESTLEVSKATAEHTIVVQTNYPGGWIADVAQEHDWISILTSYPSGTPAEENVDLILKVSENEDPGNREGLITLTCGDNHLSLDVMIIQTDEEHYELTILINDPKNEGGFIEFDKIINFHSGLHNDLKPRTLKIEWKPANKPLTINFNPYYEWGTETEREPEIQEGTATFKVVPSKLSERNEFYPVSVGDIEVMVNDEPNTKQNILIRRTHFEVYIEKSDSYTLDGKEHSFKLYSNTDWKAEIPEDHILPTYQDTPIRSANVMTFTEKSQGEFNLDANGEGEDIKFKLEDIEENISAGIPVLISFKDGDEEEWVTKEYIFTVYKEKDPDAEIRFAAQANCYVLQTGGDGVYIPASQANRFSTETGKNYFPTVPIGNNDELAVKFIWTDHVNGFNKNGDDNAPVVFAEMEEGNSKGPGARLVVKSGNVPGNAVIAVVSNKGTSNEKIHWSWHIWVVDKTENFDPYNDSAIWKGFRFYEFLDRNLGALSADPDDPKSRGLYYQWGRKDPFPGPVGIASTTLSARYDAAGNEIGPLERRTTVLSWQQYNLANSILNPTVLMAPTNTVNWCSGDYSTTQTYDFWSEMKDGNLSSAGKGIFDPCPEGWKTVPAGNSLNDQWKILFQVTQYYNESNYSEIKGSLTDGTPVDLGKWAHAGYLDGSSGQIINERQGAFWTGTGNDFNNGWRTLFKNQGQPEPATSHNRRDALSIRCMRRVD